MKAEEKRAYFFFSSHVGSIEVWKDKELQQVYFPIKPVCRYLTDDAKTQFSLTVNRSTPGEKVEGLLSASVILIMKMQHALFLDSIKFKIFTTGRMKFLRNLSTALGIFINLIMLIYYRFDDDLKTV